VKHDRWGGGVAQGGGGRERGVSPPCFMGIVVRVWVGVLYGFGPQRALACEIDDIVECLSDYDFPIECVGFETGTMSQHLYFGLEAAGLDVVCMEARQVNAAHAFLGSAK